MTQPPPALLGPPRPALPTVMPARRRSVDPWLLAVLVGAAALYLYDLDVSRWANSYYSAAADAGARSWKAFLLGSLDAGNATTVDKPPLALWPMALSVRLFGLSPWSLLVPQAVEGVVAVALVHACVKRVTGSRGAAALAAAAFALTPVCTLMFRYDNPDALMTTLLLGAALCALAALTSGRSRRLMVLAGALVGLAFLTKMLEAVLVLPALLLAFQVCGPGTAARRLGTVVLSGGAAVVAGGWWVVLVEVWPSSARPYVGGSASNSVIDLTLGYNGAARIGGSGSHTLGDNGLGATNLARLARTDVAGEFLWLLAPTLVLTVVAAWSTWAGSRRPLRGAWLMWTAWLLGGLATFAAMAGIFHSYYTILLVPAVCALLGTASWVVWQAPPRRSVRIAVPVCGLAAAATSVPTLAASGTAALLWVVPVLALTCWPLVRPGWRSLDPRPALASVLAGALLGPLVFSVATAGLPHTGSSPMAGPGHGSSTRLLLEGPVPGASPIGAVLRTGGQGYRWAAAVPGARYGAALELSTGLPMLTIGGYPGTDPFPGVADFAAAVAAHQVRYLVVAGTRGDAADAVVAWASARYPLQHATDGTPYLDLDPPGPPTSGP